MRHGFLWNYDTLSDMVIVPRKVWVPQKTFRFNFTTSYIKSFSICWVFNLSIILDYGSNYVSINKNKGIRVGKLKIYQYLEISYQLYCCLYSYFMHESQNKRTRSNFLQRLHLKVLKTKFGSNFFKRVLTSFENLTMLSRALQS